MQFIKTILLSISFWSLVFSPVVFAKTEMNTQGFSDVVKAYNDNNFKINDLMKVVKDNNVKTYESLEDYFKKNGINDLGTIPLGQMQNEKDGQFKLIIEKKEFLIQKINVDTFRISYNGKSTKLNLKEGNVDEWVNAINTLNIEKVSFHFSELFISDAHAISYAILIAVGVVLGVLYAYNKGKSMAFESIRNGGKFSCKQLKDTTLEKDDPSVTSSYSKLKAAYAENCPRKPGSDGCVEARNIIECLDSFIHPTQQQADAQRDSKPADSSAGAEDGAYSAGAIGK